MSSETIFFGGDDCYKDMYLTHKMLEDAFRIIGGLQQPAHSTSAEELKREFRERKFQKTRLKQLTIQIVKKLGQEDLLKPDNFTYEIPSQ